MGVNKLVKAIEHKYVFGLEKYKWKMAKLVKRQCNVCQACEPLTWSKVGKIDMTPIPPKIMQSVAMDIFSPPKTSLQGVDYDALILCVDRQSGLIIAIPTQKKGLTAEKMGHLMLENGWNIFGIPSIITSDQGPSFVGPWWRTMCARLGVRVAYSQAHRAQGNGRAEVAGKQIYNLLRKMHTEDKINW